LQLKTVVFLNWCLICAVLLKSFNNFSFDVDEEQQPQQGKQQLPVPVPVYCRPLMEKEPGMKVINYASATLGQVPIQEIKKHKDRATEMDMQKERHIMKEMQKGR